MYLSCLKKMYKNYYTIEILGLHCKKSDFLFGVCVCKRKDFIETSSFSSWFGIFGYLSFSICSYFTLQCSHHQHHHFISLIVCEYYSFLLVGYFIKYLKRVLFGISRFGQYMTGLNGQKNNHSTKQSLYYLEFE